MANETVEGEYDYMRVYKGEGQEPVLVRLYKERSAALRSGSTCFTVQTEDGVRYIGTASTNYNNSAVIKAVDATGPTATNGIRYMLSSANKEPVLYGTFFESIELSELGAFEYGGIVVLYGGSGEAGHDGTKGTPYGEGGAGGEGGKSVTVTYVEKSGDFKSATAAGGGGGGGGGNGGTLTSSTTKNYVTTTVYEERYAGIGGAGGAGAIVKFEFPTLTETIRIEIRKSESKEEDEEESEESVDETEEEIIEESEENDTMDGEKGVDGATRVNYNSWGYSGGQGGAGGASGDGNAGEQGYWHVRYRSYKGRSRNSKGGDGGYGGSGSVYEAGVSNEYDGVPYVEVYVYE